MSSDRNQRRAVLRPGLSLVDWDMSSDRNPFAKRPAVIVAYATLPSSHFANGSRQGARVDQDGGSLILAIFVIATHAHWTRATGQFGTFFLVFLLRRRCQGSTSPSITPNKPVCLSRAQFCLCPTPWGLARWAAARRRRALAGWWRPVRAARCRLPNPARLLPACGAP